MRSVYVPPPGGVYVPNPRSISDILIRSLAIHLFSICSYAHLTYWSPSNKSKTVYVRDVFLFVLSPELVIWHLLEEIVGCFLKYRKARLERWNLPQQNVSEKDTTGKNEENKPRKTPHIFHLLMIITYSFPLLATVFAYRERLNIRYRAATYVGNLGIDHRNGWISIGGLIAAGATAILLCAGALVLPKQETGIIEPTLNLEVGLNSIKKLRCLAFLTLFHALLLSATNRIINPLTLLLLPLWTRPVIPIWLYGILVYVVWGICVWLYPPWRISKLDFLRQTIAIYFATLWMIQGNFDIDELVQVSYGQVRSYNYRWKVKDLVSGRT
jgi:hypothetical protein